MPASIPSLPWRLGAALCLSWVLTTTAAAQAPRKQDWVGVWEQAHRRIVITAPMDGAADAIVIRAYPQGLAAQEGGGHAPVVTLQGFDNNPGRPIDTDGGEQGRHRIQMRIEDRQLHVEQDRSADPRAHDLSGVYRRNTQPLALLWAERPGWLRFACDCDTEAIRQSVLQQLGQGHAEGKDTADPDNMPLLIDTVDTVVPTVLVITHSHDGVCSKDSFRIVSRSADGQWRGEVARWLGLAPQPGGIQDRSLWQLTAQEKQRLAALESGDASVVPRFWWDHAQRTLKVGMESCVVLPDSPSPKDTARARQLEAFATRFTPRRYRLVPATPAR